MNWEVQVNKMIRILAIMVIVAVLAPTLMGQENRDTWPKSTFMESAKISYKYEYKKTKLRVDLYKSIDLLRDAANRFPHDPELYFMLGTYFAEIDALDTMVAYFDSVAIYCADESTDKKLLKKCEKEFQKKVADFRQDYWERSYNDAVNFLSQYDTVAMWMNASVSEDSLKHLDSLKQAAFNVCKDNFENAIMLKPEDPLGYDGLGILYQREDDFVKAIEYYKKSMEISGENCEDIGRIAYAYIAQKDRDWQEVTAWFEKYTGCNADDISAMLNLAVAYGQQDQLEKSHEVYGKILEKDPGNTQALFNSGQYWFIKMRNANAEMSNYPDSIPSNQAKRRELEQEVNEFRGNAIDMFERIISVAPEEVDAMRQLGILYLISQKNEEAAAVFSKAIEITPNDQDILDYLGRSYIQLGDFQSAIEPYERLVESDPGNVDAWERLAELYRYTDQPDKAAKAESRAQELKDL